MRKEGAKRAGETRMRGARLVSAKSRAPVRKPKASASCKDKYSLELPLGANFGPEGALDLIDKSRLVLCTGCGGIRGLWGVVEGSRLAWYAGKRGRDYRQFCECEYAAAPGRKPRGYRRWDIRDFNCMVELCRTCSLDAISSGTKWSSYHCWECLRRAQRFNAKARRCVVPIGYDSLMNGVGSDLSDTPSSPQIESFLEASKELIAGANHLSAWRGLSVRKNVERFGLGLGPDVQLVDYLALAAPSREHKAEIFDALLEWLTQAK